MKHSRKLSILSAFVITIAASSCSMQRHIAFVTDGKNANVSGGVIHPTTEKPVTISYPLTNDSTRNKY